MKICGKNLKSKNEYFYIFNSTLVVCFEERPIEEVRELRLNKILNFKK